MHDSEKMEPVDEVAYAQRQFISNATDAARQICYLSQDAANESVRLSAAKYVVDRALGRVAADSGVGGSGGGDDPLDKFLASVVGASVTAAGAAGSAAGNGDAGEASREQPSAPDGIH